MIENGVDTDKAEGLESSAGKANSATSSQKESTPAKKGKTT